MLPVVVGRPTWKKRTATSRFSDVATPSDEAFMLVALLNSMNRWAVKYTNGNNLGTERNDNLPSPLFTHGPNTTASASIGSIQLEKKKRSGWNNEGRLHFVRFHRATVAFRNTKAFAEIEDALMVKLTANGRKCTVAGMDMPALPMDF